MSSKVLFVLFFLALLFASNKWMDWTQANIYLTADDVTTSYELIAKAAPKFPTELLTYHHAQRFFFPYMIGATANTLGLPFVALFRFAVIFCILLIVGVFHKILAILKVDRNTYLVAMALLIWNVYAFRYYLLVPGMVSDLGFVLGLALSLLSFYCESLGLLAFGLVVMTLGRQTGVMTIPGFFLWALLRWQPRRKKWIASVLAALLPLVVYWCTGKIAENFAKPSINSEHLIGIFLSLQTGSIAAHLLLLLRLLLPHLMALILLSIGVWKVRKLYPNALFLLLLSAGIVGQPILTGLSTGQNGGRLSVLAIFPLLLVCAAHSSNSKLFAQLSQRKLISILAVLFLASFHHMYSMVGPSSPQAFLFLQLSLGAILGGLLLWIPSLQVLKKKTGGAT